MARRRKKTGRNAAQRSKLTNSVLDKSLPAIPPPEARATHYLPENEAAYSHNYSSSTIEGPSISQTISELRDPESRPSTADQGQTHGRLPAAARPDHLLTANTRCPHSALNHF
jgi:hypothetical protein